MQASPISRLRSGVAHFSWEIPQRTMFQRFITIDGWNPANQLRLVVYPIIYRVLAPSQVVSRISTFSTINRFIPKKWDEIVDLPVPSLSIRVWMSRGPEVRGRINGEDGSMGYFTYL